MLIRSLVWILSLLGALVASFLFIGGITESASAPQQGAAAAIGVGVAVIPYCFARAVCELVALAKKNDAAVAQQQASAGEPKLRDGFGQ
jgi:hypothetical protein